MKLSIHKFDKPHIRSFCSFALPLILLLLISLPGVALCFGSDGHVALERYSEELCNEVGSASDSGESTNSFLRNLNNTNAQHCGTCVDIPISDNTSEVKVISSNDLMPEIDLHSLVTYVSSTDLFIENLNPTDITQDLPKNNYLLDTLQTTIIIC